MRRGLDMDKIARALGAVCQGKVSATGGYFGAMQLLADIEARFRQADRRFDGNRQRQPAEAPVCKAQTGDDPGHADCAITDLVLQAPH